VTAYLVAGGIFQDMEGNEVFALVCPSTGALPYVMQDSMRPYFKLIWQNAHLYKVEEDYSLALVDPSPEALQWGVQAPERVTPEPDLYKILRTACNGLPAKK
jgi:hypothetical protein